MDEEPASIDREFVETYSRLYVATMRSNETSLFEEVGPAVAARGYFTLDDLLEVGSWKANRTTGYLRKNTAEDVEGITRIALGAPLRLRHRILTLLDGVQRAMASALLTVWNPHQHTIIDRNALGTLRHFCRLTKDHVTYLDYLRLCQTIVDDIGGVTLRDLDRALWKWWDVSKPTP